MISAVNGPGSQPSLSIEAVARKPQQQLPSLANTTSSLGSSSAVSSIDWKQCKVRVMEIMELMPDLSTVFECTGTIVMLTCKVFPTPIRVAFAAACLLNFTLVVPMATHLYHLVVRLIPKLSKGLALDYTVKLVYWGSLVAVFNAVGLLGVRECCRMLHKGHGLVEKMLGYLLPWIGYAMRVSTYLQIADIVSGTTFQREIDVALKCDDKPKNKESILRSIFGTSVKGYASEELSTMQKTALRALHVLKERRHYLRRVNYSAGGKGLKARILELEAQLRKPWQRNPSEFVLASAEAQRLARDLRTKSIQQTQYQIFGLGANMFALMAMTATHAIAIPVLSIGSAICYMSQTAYGWKMPSTVPYKRPQEAQLSEYERALESIAHTVVQHP